MGVAQKNCVWIIYLPLLLQTTEENGQFLLAFICLKMYVLVNKEKRSKNF